MNMSTAMRHLGYDGIRGGGEMIARQQKREDKEHIIAPIPKGTMVTPHIAEALATEYEKLGRTLTPEETGIIIRQEEREELKRLTEWAWDKETIPAQEKLAQFGDSATSTLPADKNELQGILDAGRGGINEG